MQFLLQLEGAFCFRKEGDFQEGVECGFSFSDKGAEDRINVCGGISDTKECQRVKIWKWVEG